MNRKRIKRLLLIILLLIISVPFLNKQISNKSNRIDNIVVESNVDISESVVVDTETYVSPIEDLQKKYGNQDIVAKLEINDIDLEDIITKSNDNEYYLYHNIYQVRSDFGNSYMDYRNELNLDNERQINIYSHNFYDKTYSDYLPFSKLEKYLDKEVFDNAKEINLYIDNKLIKYEVYAIKIVTKENNEHMVLDASSNQKWLNHLDKLLTDTKYCKDDCHLSSDDKILILQTCNYNPNNSFILVIGRKIK